MSEFPRFCPQCGTQQSQPGARFCQNCGRPLPARVAPAVPEPVPSPLGAPRHSQRWLWLTPVLLLVAVAAALLILEPTRMALLAVLGRTPDSLGAETLAQSQADRFGATATPLLTIAPARVPAVQDTAISLSTATTLPSATALSTATSTPTATLPPTATPQPTATPTPTATGTPQAVVRATSLTNVRTGPSTLYPVIGQASAGTEWLVLGRNQTGDWWQICCVQEQPGWILAKLTASTGPIDVPVIADIAAPPSPGLVVFASDRNGYAHLFTMDGNGEGLRAVTSGQEYYWDPILSPDGSRIAYVSKIGDNTEVFVASRTGADRRAISNHPAADDHPAWFPGNAELAFASQRDGPWQIYRMNADGSNVRRLTWSGGDDRFLDVSPDGKRIAYVSLAAPYPTIQVMVMDSDGSNVQPVLTYESREQRDDVSRLVYRPDWSPDGRFLAFGADDDNNRTISLLVIDVTTGDVRRLIEEGHGPVWSPDGQRLIYKPAGDRQILFIADANGQFLTQLTDATYNAWSPDWAP